MSRNHKRKRAPAWAFAAARGGPGSDGRYPGEIESDGILRLLAGGECCAVSRTVNEKENPRFAGGPRGSRSHPRARRRIVRSSVMDATARSNTRR